MPVCISERIHTHTHIIYNIVFNVSFDPGGGSSLFHVVLCSCAVAAPVAAPITAAPAAAAQDLREVVHDGGLFKVHQVELPDE